MAPARFHDTTVLIACGPALWRAKGERLLFAGFLAAMPRPEDDGEEGQLPPMAKGENLNLQKLDKEQKFTQPPPRFTEASLVRELEERGIGRPSTYAAIISTIQDREYVRQEDKHFVPTDLGSVVCSQLREHFPRLMDTGFTAAMEEDLDKVAEGHLGWVNLLRSFNGDFNPALAAASRNMAPVKAGLTTDMPCPKCGRPMVIKFGKSGEFLACSGYPECRHTTDFTRDEKGKIRPRERQQEEREVVGQCPQCGGAVIVKKSHTGSRFKSCANYPACTYAAPFSTGVPCPRCGKGMLAEKSSKRGKIFYSCDQYPACDYALWDWPVAESCPQCGSPLLVRKKTRAKGEHIACPNPQCGYVREGE
jgi:DNA topoisomerase-1